MDDLPLDRLHGNRVTQLSAELLGPRSSGDGHRPAREDPGVGVDAHDATVADTQSGRRRLEAAQAVAFGAVEHCGRHQAPVDPGRRPVVQDTPDRSERGEERPGLVRRHLGDRVGRTTEGETGTRGEPLVLAGIGRHQEQTALGETGLGCSIGGQAAHQLPVVGGGGATEREPAGVGIPGRLGREDAGPGITGPTGMVLVDEDDVGAPDHQLIGQGGADQTATDHGHLAGPLGHGATGRSTLIRRTRRRCRQPRS